MQVAEETSAQLQQQLARKGTHLSSAQRELARLRQELSQAQQSKLEAIKVNLVLCLHNDNILHMATGLDYCNCLPSIKDACCADTCSVHFISALSEEDCCMTLQADSYAGFFCQLQERSVQLQLQLLQKQLDRKVTELGCLQNQLPGLHAELGRMTKAKEVNAQVSCKTTVFDCLSQVVILRQPPSCWWVGSSTVLWLRLLAVSAFGALWWIHCSLVQWVFDDPPSFGVSGWNGTNGKPEVTVESCIG